MLTQNRVQDVLTRLPEDVQRLGVQVRKAIPSILLAIHLYSPDESRDTLYLSNYATLHIKDVLGSELPYSRSRMTFHRDCNRLSPKAL
jgi:HAE1 family hydrophobic/amphiphilic exporter-1